MKALKRLLMEVRTPEVGDPYKWAVIGAGHILLGMALQGLLGVAGAFARLGIAVFYWIAKERNDLKKGGTLKDGLVDAAFVGVGSFYDGSRWFPIACIITLAIGAWLKESQRGTKKTGEDVGKR